MLTVCLRKWIRSQDAYIHHLARRQHLVDGSRRATPISRIFLYVQKLDGKSGAHSSLTPVMSCSPPTIHSSSCAFWLISRTNHAWWKHSAKMKISIPLQPQLSLRFLCLE